jgi:hypothetical protein
MRVKRSRLALAVIFVGLSTLVWPAASPAETFLAECSGGAGAVAPSAWSSGCLGGSANFDSLSWSGWGAEEAVASGQARPNDCDPDCARGTIYSYPARFVAKGLSPCLAEPGNTQYTSLETVVEYPAGNPFNVTPGPHISVWPVDAANCTALVATFEQGTGIVLVERPKSLEARRNIRAPSFSGRDGWVIRKWLSFGGPRAVAEATYWWHTPDGSNFRHYRARLVLDRLGRCGSLHIYTRISGRFLGHKPPRLGRVVRKAPWHYEYC